MPTFSWFDYDASHKFEGKGWKADLNEVRPLPNGVPSSY